MANFMASKVTNIIDKVLGDYVTQLNPEMTKMSLLTGVLNIEPVAGLPQGRPPMRPSSHEAVASECVGTPRFESIWQSAVFGERAGC